MVNQTFSVQPADRTGSVLHILRTLGASLLKSLSLRHLMALSICCVTAVYVALILDYDMLMYVSGLIGLSALRICDYLKSAKGGAL